MGQVRFERVVVAIAAGVVALALITDPGSWWQAAALIAAAAAVSALVLDGTPLWVCGPTAILGAAAANWDGYLEPGLFLLSTLALIVASGGPLTLTATGTLAAALATPAALAALRPSVHFSGAIWTIGIAFPAAMGYVVRRQSQLSEELAAARLALAEQALTEERRRIARDVHDLVGHGLAAALVQVASARHVLRRDPDAADDALAAAERAGRSSLRELRTTLAALRFGDDGATALPGAADIEELVASARVDGLSVTFRADRDASAIEGVAGLTLHRIAQEALANALRHAPTCDTVVELVREGDRTTLRVRSRGASPTPPDGPTFGLRGMRERAEAVGGALTAGADADGWLVEASVPVEEAR
jgi:signal transduction histidine kinase